MTYASDSEILVSVKYMTLSPRTRGNDGAAGLTLEGMAMRMSRMVYLGLVMLLSMLVLPMATTAQGNKVGSSDAAAACEEEDYLNYTDADSRAFKNAGQCTSYAAQVHTLVPVPVLPAPVRGHALVPVPVPPIPIPIPLNPSPIVQPATAE